MNSFEEIILYYLQLLFLPFLQFKAVQIQDFSFNTVSMSDTAARVSRVLVFFPRLVFRSFQTQRPGDGPQTVLK